MSSVVTMHAVCVSYSMGEWGVLRQLVAHLWPQVTIEKFECFVLHYVLMLFLRVLLVLPHLFDFNGSSSLPFRH